MDTSDFLIYKEAEDGYLYPSLKMSNGEAIDISSLGKYGRMALEHLKKNHHHSYLYLLLEGDLLPLMKKLDEEAKFTRKNLEEKLLMLDPILHPESTYDTYKHLNMIRMTAEEIVLTNIIYTNFAVMNDFIKTSSKIKIQNSLDVMMRQIKKYNHQIPSEQIDDNLTLIAIDIATNTK